MKFRLVDSDNYGGDYPNEKYVKDGSIKLNFTYETTMDEKDSYYFSARADAQQAANEVNSHWEGNSPRYLKVVQDGYELQPGFEP